MAASSGTAGWGQACAATVRRSPVPTVVLLVTACLLLYVANMNVGSAASGGGGFQSTDAAGAISGVSGVLWKPKRVREWKGPRNVAHDMAFHEDTPSRETASKFDPSKLDAWFRRGEPGVVTTAEASKRARNACVSDKWVVITSIFAPSELMRVLTRTEGWCTVVVADKKTPESAYAEMSGGPVKLLSVSEQTRMAGQLRVMRHLPWNHFGRKNIGFLYAIAQGARYIYDTDDDNILKTDAAGNGHIPVISAASPPHLVAQAFHCGHSNGANRTWNPYVMFGTPTSWPRGLPLDDITVSQAPCTHAQPLTAGGEPSSDANPAYQLAYHHPPGISFAVQQSLADGHPDIDAIHRLTRRPLTFSFKADTPFRALYGPDHVYAPYNAQATLHHYDAFWSLLLPVTVHGRVSDIWRSYFAQRLMWEYGMRVVFTRPFVDQDRTPHNYLKDFQSEDQLYMRAGALVEFLDAWKPSSPSAPLPVQHEELLIALYEHDILGEADVLVGQAWLADLKELGYVWPTRATHGLYSAWKSARSGKGVVVQAPNAATLDEAKAALTKSLTPLQVASERIVAAVLYPEPVSASAGRPAWEQAATREALRQAFPGFILEFHGVHCMTGKSQDNIVCSGGAAHYNPSCHAAAARIAEPCTVDAAAAEPRCVAMTPC